MANSSCRPATGFLTELLGTAEVVAPLQELRASGAKREDYVEFFAARAPADVAGTLREEFASLPALAMTTLVEAWAHANSSGRPLQVASLQPTDPLDYARQRRVRIVTDVEEEQVTVTLSHLPNRHPS